MSNTHSSERGLLDYAAASRLLGVPRGTLSRWVLERRIPHIRLGDRTVRFDAVELREWLRSQRVPARRAPSSRLATMDAALVSGGDR